MKKSVNTTSYERKQQLFSMLSLQLFLVSFLVYQNQSHEINMIIS